MRTRFLLTMAGWLASVALLSAQPINPGAQIELPTNPIAVEEAQTDVFGEPGVIKNPAIYASFDNLFWWTKPNQVDRPIVGSLVNPSADYGAFPGAGGLNDPNTRVLFGNREISYGMQWGLRGTLQMAFDDMNTKVLEIGGMYLPRQSETFLFRSNAGVPALSLLANNVTGGLPGQQSALPVAGLLDGNLLNGAIGIDSYTELWEGEANMVYRNVQRNCPLYWDYLLGYRHQGLKEGFSIWTQRTNGPSFSDSFRTQNLFHGAQFGGRIGYQLGHFSLQWSSKTALGWTNQQIVTGPQVGSGLNGFFTQPSNIGRYTDSQFGVIFDCMASLTWSISPNLAVSGGYNWFWWNRVVRPTTQLDSNININQVPGATNPYNPFQRQDRTSFWAQGAVFQVEVMY